MIAAFYAVGMMVLLMYGLNLLWLAVGYARTDHQRPGKVPQANGLPEAPKRWPRVTVQIPLYNEQHVAKRIIDACAQLEYPADRLEVQVLDDSNDKTVEIVRRRVDYWQAKGVSICQVRRSSREGFKAGALANGMQEARGDLLAVFDADFVPKPDFLLRTVPCFKKASVGMVQARWEHLNDGASWLTRIQALSLDTHFGIEQAVRQRLNCFINFNGTAGIWRRRCIEEAGGWAGDVLTEDLDLSYRAQLKGWQLEFVSEVGVPAELPVDVNGLRTQQFRWAKGSVQTALKLLGPLWRSTHPLRVKLEGSLHLTAHMVFPFVLLVAALHAPLTVMKSWGNGPDGWYFGLMGLGLWAFVGVGLSQLFAQRLLYPRWLERMKGFLWFMAGSMGLAINNSQAVFEALLGKSSPFVRTPKFRVDPKAPQHWMHKMYASGQQIPALAWAEAAAAVYCLAGLGVIAALEEWAALPFQALFVLGFGFMSGHSFYQVWSYRQQG